MVQAWKVPQQSFRSGGSIPIEAIFYHKNTTREQKYDRGGSGTPGVLENQNKNQASKIWQLLESTCRACARKGVIQTVPASSHISQGHKVFVFIVQNCIFCVVRFAGLRGGSHRKVTPLEEKCTLTWGKTKI